MADVSPDSIEKYVQARRIARAKAEIKLWLKANPRLEARLQACNWLRRLGSFQDAYRTIAPEHFDFRRARSSNLEALRYLMCARMLNLIGASHFALQVSRRLGSFETAETNRILANIHLTNFDFPTALRFYDLADRLDSEPTSYASRIARIESCDALVGMGGEREAIDRVREITAAENETLLQGILLQAEGEYLVRLGSYREGIALLEKAAPYFSDEDQTIDRLLLLKWTGLAKLGLGREKPGHSSLNLAIRGFRKPDSRAEAWLDCLYWKRRLGRLSRSEEDLLQAYPGLEGGFTERYPLQPEYELAGSELWISFPRREWTFRGRAHHFLSREIELLGLLRRSHPHGLNMPRFVGLLWPDEPSSFLQLEGRIQQLIRQLRGRHGFEVQTRNREVFLSPSDAKRVAVEVRTPHAYPIIFREKREVSLDEAARFYGLKRWQTSQVAAKWIESGRVRSTKIGRNVLLRTA